MGRIVSTKFFLIITFIVLGFVFFTLPEQGIASVAEGCCINESNGTCLDDCNGCAVAESYCIAQGGSPLSSGDICVGAAVMGGSASCQTREDEPGCCMVQTGLCQENLDSRECFDNLDGIIWEPGAPCSEMPDCSATVPAFNTWGLIALAGVLGVIGFIMVMRRNKATV